MIENIDPKVRKRLMQERCLAMRGEVPDVLNRLTALTTSLTAEGRSVDALAASMLHAELLHINDQDLECAALFDSVIVPGSVGLTKELTLIAGFNRAEVNLALFRPNDFYSLVDQARIIGFKVSDSDTVLSAETDAVKGDHFKALPAFWREVVRTFRQTSWMASRQATSRLGRECLQIRMPHEAAWYAVLSLNDELAKQAAQGLLDSRNVRAIRETVQGLLANANLPRHFSVACEIISALADGIPDDQVDAVAAWLLPRCNLPRGPRLAAGTLNMAWKALDPIAYRLAPPRAQEAMNTAIHHTLWNVAVSAPNAVSIERKTMVEAMTRLVHALPSDTLGSLAEQVLPLATDRRMISDYSDVVNLLCHIAGRADESVKKQIGDRLFGSGEPVSYDLGQVASFFGRRFLPPEQLSPAAEQVRQWILLQVQRLPPGQDPRPLSGSLGFFTNPLPDQTLVVHFASHVQLETISRHRHSLPSESVASLVQAILTMIREPENFLINRAGLIHGLRDFGDCLSDVLLEEVFETLAPLARGVIVEPPHYPPASAADDPLNPHKMRTGSPADVRGAGLRSLARIERTRPNVYLARFEPILEEALSDLDADVRRAAFAAAGELPQLSEATLMAVLQGMRDSDPNAAATAFWVVASKTDQHLSPAQWRLFLYAGKMASQSPAIALRTEAAAALARLAPDAPTGALRESADQLLGTFSMDVSATVREAEGRKGVRTI